MMDRSGRNLGIADFTRADLSGDSFVGSRVRYSSFWGETAIQANFEKAELHASRMCLADLRDANFNHAQLVSVNFAFSDLTGASFVGANCSDAFFSNAVMHNVDLRGARLVGAVFDNVDLSTVDLSGAVGIDGQTGPLRIRTDLLWTVMAQGKMLRIGCQTHSFDKWKAFSDEEIDDMSTSALAFWRYYRDELLAM